MTHIHAHSHTHTHSLSHTHTLACTQDEATLKSGTKDAKGRSDSAALKSRVKVVHLILVAVLAFLIGHFTSAAR
jgi:hypothetical protein